MDQPKLPDVGMLKKQSVFAFLLILLIPIVTMAGGFLSNLIDPEIAAHHPNYVRNYHLLSLLKHSIFLGSIACAGVLWIVACLLVILSKKRSPLWLVFGALGPLGFAVLATLNDRQSAQIDRYTLFLRSMNWMLRTAYEFGFFIAVWVLAWELMLLNREMIIDFQAVTTGVSRQQIIDVQSASSGMWAFAEGNEVLYLVALLYVLRPILFNLGSAVLAKRSARNTMSS